MDKSKKSLQDIFEDDDLGLLDVKPQTTVRNENDRLVASFNEVIDFYKKNKREPEPGGSIAERSLYYRLKGIRENKDKVNALNEHDTCNLLSNPNEKEVKSINDILNDDFLGILESGDESIFTLKNIPKETTMPDYVARRKPCKDFEKFEHLLKQCQVDLTSGKRKLIPFRNEQEIDKGYFFVLKGVLLYVVEVGGKKLEKGKLNARLRCIFENGTESDMLLRSLSAELYKHGRRVTEHADNVLVNITPEDEETGLIYVLKSKSTDPDIKAIDNLYKIGYSKNSVEERIKNAEQDPTFLMAPVSIVTTFKCYNMNPQKLEKLLHNFFGNSCLNIEVIDKKGYKHKPREWFIAPLAVIEETIYYIQTEKIVNYKYDLERQIIVGK